MEVRAGGERVQQGDKAQPSRSAPGRPEWQLLEQPGLEAVSQQFTKCYLCRYKSGGGEKKSSVGEEVENLEPWASLVGM